MKILRLRNVWERLAREDPYWAVLTAPDKAGNRWSLDEFFATGRREVEASLARIAKYCPAAPRGAVLDFGCGVGRLTQALGLHYDAVVGVDVAARMIALAEAHNVHPERIRFLHNTRRHLRCFNDASFDLVFSLITLQHIPAPLNQAYVREFVRVTRPGGLLYFQAPTQVEIAPVEVKRWSWYAPTMMTRLRRWYGRWWRRFSGRGDNMRMHALPPAIVREILTTAGADLIATLDHPHDANNHSQIYLARKLPQA